MVRFLQRILKLRLSVEQFISSLRPGNQLILREFPTERATIRGVSVIDGPQGRTLLIGVSDWGERVGAEAYRPIPNRTSQQIALRDIEEIRFVARGVIMARVRGKSSQYYTTILVGPPGYDT